MKEWKKSSLNEIADIKLSNVDKKTKDNEKQIRLCNYTDIYKNSFINSQLYDQFMVATCNESEFKKFRLCKGQVAITKDSEKRDDIGISACVSEDFNDVVLGYHLALIKPKDTKLSGEYLHYWLNTIQAKKFFENNASGSGQRFSLNLDTIQDTPIYHPSLSTQKKIASVLSALDAKIALNNKINADLEAMAKTIYDYWFVQYEFPNEKGKPYRSSGGKMVWNEELKREIPVGWKVGSILDIATLLNGLPCQKYFTDSDDHYKVIKIREMQAGLSKTSDKVGKNFPEKYLISNGDILFSWSATLIIDIWYGEVAALNQHIFKVIPKGYPSSFVYFQIKNYIKKFQSIAENRKTTMGHITKEHLQSSLIVIPPKEILKNQNNPLANIFLKISNLKTENQSLTSLRNFLLPLLMNGQVSVGE